MNRIVCDITGFDRYGNIGLVFVATGSIFVFTIPWWFSLNTKMLAIK
jgi:hypothetical protein